MGEAKAALSGKPCPRCAESGPVLKTLPCGHDLCPKCLTSEVESGSILCPTSHCLKSHDASAGPFPSVYQGSTLCEECRESKAAKDLWWCSAEGCHRLLCSLCRVTQHPQDHSATITPFASLAGVDEVYSTLRCEEYKRRQLLKAFFVEVAEELWRAETSTAEQLGRLFPLDTDEEREPNVSEELDANRATGLGRRFVRLMGEEPGIRADLLARAEKRGAKELAAAILPQLRPPQGNLPKSTLAKASQTKSSGREASTASPSHHLPSNNPGSGSMPLVEVSSQRPPMVPVAPMQRPIQASSTQPLLQPARPDFASLASPVHHAPPAVLATSATQKILVMGGKGRAKQIETLFPARVERVELLDDVVGGIATMCLTHNVGVYLYGTNADKIQTLRYNSTNKVVATVLLGNRLPAELHRGGSGLSVRTTRGDSIVLLAGGGTEDGALSNACERYLFGAWSSVAPMSAKRSDFALVHLGDFVYAIGGRGSTSRYLNSVERLAVDKPYHWSGICTVKAMPERLRDLAAASFAGRIVVAGGEAKASGKATRASIAFDPEANAWAKLPRMNFARKSHGLVVADGALYAIGGEGDGSVDAARVAQSIERMGPALDRWTLLPETTALPAVASAFAVI